jgi:hypothetical protein
LNLRIVFLGVGWMFVMALLYFTPIPTDQVLYFNAIPSRSLIHALLMWGFVHIWVAALKKQLKYEYLKRNAFKIVFSSAILIAIVSELLIYGCQISTCFSFWNLIFDIFGACIGIISFRILYSQCY